VIAPAPGSTSRASTFLSLTPRDYVSSLLRPRVLSRAPGRALACPSAPCVSLQGLMTRRAYGSRTARSPVPPAAAAAVAME
jgi:hypothetical protein